MCLWTGPSPSLSPAVNEERPWTLGNPGLVVTAIDNVVAWHLSISNILDVVARKPGRLLLAADIKRARPTSTISGDDVATTTMTTASKA
jgi:hypothetical protein